MNHCNDIKAQDEDTILLSCRKQISFFTVAVYYHSLPLFYRLPQARTIKIALKCFNNYKQTRPQDNWVVLHPTCSHCLRKFHFFFPVILHASHSKVCCYRCLIAKWADNRGHVDVKPRDAVLWTRTQNTIHLGCTQFIYIVCKVFGLGADGKMIQTFKSWTFSCFNLTADLSG